MRDMLARFPHAGRERADLRAGLRSWPVYPYIVFYDVDDDRHRVIIERVLHGRMELDEDDFAAPGE
jgi:toxin ParE1/3/4